MLRGTRIGRIARWGALLAAVAAGPAQGGESDLAAKVKAAYLFHLTQFVEWPTLPPEEIRICVLGSEPVGRLMGDLSNRQVRERPLRIEIDAVADPLRCQVLFIGEGDRRLPDLLKRARGASVLTVGDSEDFARRGGIVGFYEEAGKIRLEINPEAARAASLRLSAKLLAVARKVP